MSKFGKITHCNFQMYEEDEISTYLERMSRQGYALKNIVGNLYLFHCHSNEKKRYSYAVINDERSFHAADIDAEMKRFLSDSGYSDWEFVCRKPGMIVCRKAWEAEDRPAAHQMDPEKMLDMRRKSVRSFELLCSVAASIIICVGIPIVIKIKYPSADQFQRIMAGNFPFLIATGALLAFFVYYIGELYDYIVQNCRISKDTANGGYKRTKLKQVMFQAGDVLGAVLILFGLVYGIYLVAIGNSVMDVIWIFFVFVLSGLYLSPLNSRIKGCHGYLLFISMYCYMISCFFVLYR